MPKVSVIMNCLNSSKYLREAIDSIYAQTYKDWEIIFWDNASTDNSAAITKSYDDRLRYFRSEETVPLGKARNWAIKKATGEYISFLDCDDTWLPEKLERQLSIFENCAEVDFVYTNYYVVRNKRRVTKFKEKQPNGNVFERFLLSYSVHISTAMVRNRVFDKLGSLFNPTLNLTEEYDVFMRILYNHKAAYISEPLATYRYHPGMTSATQEVRLIQETLSVIGAFKLLDIDFEKKYSGILENIINKNNVGLSFKLAKDELAHGNISAANNYIKPYKQFNIKIFIFFILTCFPSSMACWLWSFFLRIKKL